MTNQGRTSIGASTPRPASLDAFTSAFDRSAGCVFVVDANGNVCYANAAFCAAVGRLAEQLAGVCIEELGRTRAGPLWQAVESGRPWTGNLSLSVEGRTRSGLVAITPIVDPSGSNRLVLCTSDALGEPVAESKPMTPASPLVLVVDLDGTILFIDRTVPGISREEAVGASIYAYMPPEHHERIRSYLAEVIETKGSLSYEVPSVGPYGTVLTYQTHVGPIERDGDVVALSFVSWEVTEHPPEVQERYRVLAEAGMEGLIIHERDVIADVNAAVCRMFGYTAEDLIGQPVRRLFAPRSRSIVRQEAFYRTGTIHEASGLRSDGTAFAIEVCGKSLPHSRGLSTVIAIREVATRQRTARAQSVTSGAKPKQATTASQEREPIDLSERELDVLELLAQGMTNREVAERIQVSARTVDHHVSHILSKLGASNRTAAAMTARRKGLLR